MQVLRIPAATPQARRRSASSQVARTRSGCWTCRDRSVKCDEIRPRCGKCERLGLSCRYGIRLQWIEDSEARGICHGREGVWSVKKTSRKARTRSPTSSPYHKPTLPAGGPRTDSARSSTFFLNTFNDDIQHYLQINRADPSVFRCTAYHGIGSLLDGETPDNDEGGKDYPCVARLGDENHQERNLAELQKPSAEELLRFHLSVPIMLNPGGLAKHLSQSDGYILHFYVGVVCSTTTILDNELHNPQRYLLMPMTTSSDKVLAAVLAIGATKLAYNDSRFRRRALVHRQQVISNVSSILGDIKSDTTRYLEALASTMILCWCDITDLCRSSWTDHLKGLSAILDACPDQAWQDPDAARLIQTAQQYLVYHVIMAKATFCLDDIMPNAKQILSKYLKGSGAPGTQRADVGTLHLYGEDSGRTRISGTRLFGGPSHLHYIEPHQGFSNALLLLVNEICDFAGKGDTTNIAKRVCELEAHLDKLIQLLPKSALDESASFLVHMGDDKIPSHRLQSILDTAEAHRIAALVFLDEICAIHLPRVTPKCRSSRLAHIEDILSLVESICDREPVTAALPIWPVFIVGCAIVAEEDRLRVLDILDKFQLRRIFGGIPPACAVIENVWRQRDLSSDENPRKPSPGSLLAPRRNSYLEYNKRRRRGGRGGRAHTGRAALSMQYPWESAMFILGNSILSLT